MAILRFSKNHDYIITISIFLLSIFSLILIFSTTFNAKTVETGVGTFKRQILFFIVGFFIYFLTSRINISYLKQSKILLLIFLATISLLVYVKIFAPEIAGTKRWITFLGFSFQPAEYAKIAIILLSSAILTNTELTFAHFIKIDRQSNLKSKKLQLIIEKINFRFPKLKKIILTISMSTPIILLVFLQPAFGNSVIMTFLLFSIIFTSLNNQLKVINFLIPIIIIPLSYWKIIALIDLFESLQINLSIFQISLTLILFTAFFSLLVATKSKLPIYFIAISILLAHFIRPITMTIWDSNILSDYQKQRIETYFESPDKDPLKAGYQVRQSKIAIGAGRLWGRGFLKGTQSTLQVLPFAHTDFIFASLAEQFGLFGSILLFIIYGIIFFRLLITASSLNDEFGVLVIAGVVIMMLLNIFINIGMNLGKLPVTGVPLPLISYGGSSVIVNMISLGLTQAIRGNIKPKDIAESFTLWS